MTGDSAQIQFCGKEGRFQRAEMDRNLHKFLYKWASQSHRFQIQAKDARD